MIISQDPFLDIFILLLTYITLLICMRIFKIGKKKHCNTCNNCCPDCNSALNRTRRERIDKWLINITFRLFEFKRYVCENCGWEGLRWEDKFNKQHQ